MKEAVGKRGDDNFTFNQLKDLADQFKGLSPKQIQQKYSLPNVPTHVVNAKIPKGARIRVGKVGANFGFRGGNTQYELMDHMQDVFSGSRLL